MRGLEHTPPVQIHLPMEGPDALERVWESFTPQSQELILRILARAIARIVDVPKEAR